MEMSGVIQGRRKNAMKAATAKKIYRLSIFVPVIMLLLSLFLQRWEVLCSIIIVSAVVILLAGNVIVLIFWRCPFCKKALPVEGLLSSMKCCPHCGCDLDEE
jgi:protein-S-isoprenylcysteine O-methyltransferase Ste14